MLRKLFPQLNVKIAYAWSAELGVTKDYVPRVQFHGKNVVLAGTISQVVSTLVAKYAAQRLLGKSQALDRLFT